MSCTEQQAQLVRLTQFALERLQRAEADFQSAGQGKTLGNLAERAHELAVRAQSVSQQRPAGLSTPAQTDSTAASSNMSSDARAQTHAQTDAAAVSRT